MNGQNQGAYPYATWQELLADHYATVMGAFGEAHQLNGEVCDNALTFPLIFAAQRYHRHPELRRQTFVRYAFSELRPALCSYLLSTQMRDRVVCMESLSLHTDTPSPVSVEDLLEPEEDTEDLRYLRARDCSAVHHSKVYRMAA